MNIYVIGSSKDKRKGIAKFVINGAQDQIVITMCLTKYDDPEVGIVDDIPNFHTTRHIDCLHNRIYKDGVAAAPPHHRYERENLDNLEENEIIQYKEISPTIFNSDAFKSYPNKKGNEMLIEDFDSSIALYSFIGPKKNILALSQKLNNYNEFSAKIFELKNFDLLIAAQRTNFQLASKVTCKLGYHIQTSDNKGIGDFKPYEPY